MSLDKLRRLHYAARRGGSRRYKTAAQLLMRDYLDDHAEAIIALIEAAKEVDRIGVGAHMKLNEALKYFKD